MVGLTPQLGKIEPKLHHHLLLQIVDLSLLRVDLLPQRRDLLHVEVPGGIVEALRGALARLQAGQVLRQGVHLKGSGKEA